MEVLERNPWLDERIGPFHIDFQDAIHVPSQIDDHAAAETRGCASIARIPTDRDWPERNLELVGQLDNLLDLGNRPGAYHGRCQQMILFQEVMGIMGIWLVQIRAVWGCSIESMTVTLFPTISRMWLIYRSKVSGSVLGGSARGVPWRTIVCMYRTSACTHQ
ncbi:hypothetical protein VTN96DRAFT_1246 [Rasamsonia emersonii]